MWSHLPKHRSRVLACGRRMGLTTLRAQPRIPPPTIARRSESSATLQDVESMMLKVAAQLSVCGSLVVQPYNVGEVTNDWKVLCFRKATRSAQVASSRPLGVLQWPTVQCACVFRVIFLAAARPTQQSRWANRLRQALPLLSPFSARRHFGHIILGKMKTI
jgi:hypothetical protein